LRKQTTKIVGGKNEFVSEDRTFFCSELVAKAFKLLKIIEDEGTSCTQFFPGHFSCKGEAMLKLTPGTSIEGEMQILVDGQDWDVDENIYER
jgi:hypothetical protein